jgi:hypothetical protein
MMRSKNLHVIAGIVMVAMTAASACLFAEPPAPAAPAGSATSQPAAQLPDVLKELRKIQPPTYEAPGVEAALVAMGKDALPALRQARAMGVKLVGDDELATNSYRNPDGNGTTVDMSPRPMRVEHLAKLRTDVLARAIVRLDFGFNPPEVLAKWAAARPAEHADSDKLPGVPQLVSSEVVARVFPDLAWCSTS